MHCAIDMRHTSVVFPPLLDSPRRQLRGLGRRIKNQVKACHVVDRPCWRGLLRVGATEKTTSGQGSSIPHLCPAPLLPWPFHRVPPSRARHSASASGPFSSALRASRTLSPH